MKTKGIVIVGVLVVVFSVAGYWFGIKRPVDGSGRTSKNQGQQPRRYTSSSNPSVNYEEVLAELKKRIAENPKDSELYANTGDILFGMRKFAEAIDYYKKAISLNPNDIDSYNDLGLANHYMGNSLEGLRFVEDGININPSYQRIYLTKGFILAYGMGNGEEAALAWEKAISLDPQSQIGRAAYAYLEEFKKR